jgi:hypothetical protein
MRIQFHPKGLWAMQEKRKAKLSGRLIYAATIVAILGVTGGVTMGAFLSTSTVTQNVNYYSGTTASVPNYAAPTLSVSSSPGACTASGTGSTTAGTVSIVLNAWSGASNCTLSDFAEKFTFAFSGTISTQVNTVRVTTQVGTFAVQSNSATITLGTGTSGAFTQTVDVYVDYPGSANPPSQGITSLSLSLQ